MNLKEIEPGIYLRQVREGANLTQDQLATRMTPSLHQQTIQKYEAGSQEPSAQRYFEILAECDPDAKLITYLETDHGD